VVDDNRDAADTCAMLLEASGHHVQTAYTGRLALELARTFRPHALLFGHRASGHRRLQARRAGPRHSLGTQCVPGCRHRHLVKPISAETVESLLQSFVRGTADPQPPPGSSDLEAGRSLATERGVKVAGR
jgi:hypothetical protein